MNREVHLVYLLFQHHEARLFIDLTGPDRFDCLYRLGRVAERRVA